MDSVIPSYLGAVPWGSTAGSEDQLLNYALREGEVKKLIPPSSSLSFSRTHPEYEILVQHRDGVGITTTTLYRGVAATSLWGSTADYTEATFRVDTTNKQNEPGNGARVLLLCVSGDQSRAVI